MQIAANTRGRRVPEGFIEHVRRWPRPKNQVAPA
jgi:hypothetical protein